MVFLGNTAASYLAHNIPSVSTFQTVKMAKMTTTIIYCACHMAVHLFTDGNELPDHTVFPS